MGESSTEPGITRPLSAIASELLDIWWQHIQPDGRVAFNLGVLCYGAGINDMLESEDGQILPPADMVRYLVAALPRAFVLQDAAKEAKADALRTELRALVGPL